MLDPVAAYDRMAGSWARLSEERRAYLEGIERLIVSAIPRGSDGGSRCEDDGIVAWTGE